MEFWSSEASWFWEESAWGKSQYQSPTSQSACKEENWSYWWAVLSIATVLQKDRDSLRSHQKYSGLLGKFKRFVVTQSANPFSLPSCFLMLPVLISYSCRNLITFLVSICLSTMKIFTPRPLVGATWKRFSPRAPRISRLANMRAVPFLHLECLCTVLHVTFAKLLYVEWLLTLVALKLLASSVTLSPYFLLVGQ